MKSLCIIAAVFLLIGCGSRSTSTDPTPEDLAEARRKLNAAKQVIAEEQKAEEGKARQERGRIDAKTEKTLLELMEVYAGQIGDRRHDQAAIKRELERTIKENGDFPAVVKRAQELLAKFK
jgi:hypothetical protein